MTVNKALSTLLCVVALNASASGITIKNLTTSTTLFQDDYEGVSAIHVPYANDTGAIDYDPVANVGVWSITESDLMVDAPYQIQVTDFQGTSGPLIYPGAIQGNNYMWVHRTNDFNLAGGNLSAVQTTAGELIHIEFMLFARPFSGGGPGVFSLYQVPDATGDRIAGIALNSNGNLSDTSGLSWTANQWQKWEIEYQVGASTYELTIDGISGTSNVLNSGGNVGSFRFGSSANLEFYVDAVPDQLASLPELQIDRTTGSIKLINNSGVTSKILGYSITSNAETLNRATWTSIADTYDMNSGNPIVDPDDNWVKLGDANSTDLSEFEPGLLAGNGANIPSAPGVNLGNAWIKNPIEDIQATVLLSDGTTVPINVTYLPGSEGLSQFTFGDLDFDGDFDKDDFVNVFAPNYLSDTSEMLAAQKYQAGDFNEDGITDIEDYIIYNNAYLVANPGAGSLSFSNLGVPEPSSQVLFFLVSLFGISSVTLTRTIIFRKRVLNLGKSFTLLLGLLFGMQLATESNATVIWNSTTDTVLFQDNFESATAISIGYADDPGTTDYDPVAITGTWEVFENLLGDPAPPAIKEIQVTDFQGTSGSLTYPGPIQGDNYMWLHRTNDLNKTNGYLTSVQSTPGEMIHVEFMAYIRNFTGGGPGVFSLYQLPDGTGDRIAGIAPSSNGSLSGDTSGVKWTANRWQKWEIDYEVGASTYEITIDGVSGTSDVLNSGGNVGSFRHSTSANVEYYVDAVPELPTLQVNRATGEITLINNSTSSIDLSIYRIASAMNSLNPGGFNGLGNSDWTVLGDTPGELSEAYFGGQTTFAGSSSISLGNAFVTGGGAISEDLVVAFQVGSTLTGAYLPGEVVYIDGALEDADFDNDGDVDGSDFLAWQAGFGAAGNNSQGDANGDNTVDGTDLAIWKGQYGTGNGSGNGSGNLTNGSVPEPSSIALFLFAVLMIGVRFKSFKQ